MKEIVSNKQLTTEEKRQAMKDSGLFLCDEYCPSDSRYCRRIFLEEWRCNRHKENNKYDFPTGVRARDWILKKASNPGGLVSTRARVNMSI